MAPCCYIRARRWDTVATATVGKSARTAKRREKITWNSKCKAQRWDSTFSYFLLLKNNRHTKEDDAIYRFPTVSLTLEKLHRLIRLWRPSTRERKNKTTCVFYVWHVSSVICISQKTIIKTIKKWRIFLFLEKRKDPGLTHWQELRDSQSSACLNSRLILSSSSLTRYNSAVLKGGGGSPLFSLLGTHTHTHTK